MIRAAAVSLQLPLQSGSSCSQLNKAEPICTIAEFNNGFIGFDNNYVDNYILVLRCSAGVSVGADIMLTRRNARGRGFTLFRGPRRGPQLRRNHARMTLLFTFQVD